MPGSSGSSLSFVYLLLSFGLASLEGVVKLLPPSALDASELFPSVDVNVKRLQVPLADVFEAEEGTFRSSFAEGQLAV